MHDTLIQALPCKSTTSRGLDGLNVMRSCGFFMARASHESGKKKIRGLRLLGLFAGVTGTPGKQNPNFGWDYVM